MEPKSEQKDILDIDQWSDVFRRRISAREVIRRVIDFLILRATKTGMEQNEDNKLGFS